ncbi:MAG: hypothetical protein HQM11_08805 [SAR324 cluster bacterium]|nr:hypothetical protein [SAR324 cluster bacterium]
MILFYQAGTRDEISPKENQPANQWRLSYWETPIPLQDKPPENFQLLAQGIQPEDCAKCHPAQFEEWSASLHSQAMSPGLLGQYEVYDAVEKARCDICHAPMSEQWEQLPTSDGNWQTNNQFDRDLKSHGVTCAACHLRNHQRHGPPLRPDRESLSEALHGAPFRTPFFETSEFCRGCHQHEANTFKPGGKTVENTYMEWLESPAYASGKTCQSCHMPDRKHLWKGIHDKDMTASGVAIRYSVSSDTPQHGELFNATLTLENTGTGHYFPTYSTPAVFMKAAFLDETGNVAGDEYYAEKILQRRLDVSSTSWNEIFDTRLAPEKSVSLKFEKRIPPTAQSFKLWVRVEPDHYYEQFYREALINNSEHTGSLLFKNALETTLQRQYTLFSKTWTISR